MARFQSLSQVGSVLAELIEAAVPNGTEIRLNVPLDTPDSSAPAVRITLLWLTPQSGHRNDAPERNPDGGLAAPPPTLSAWYLITTYGSTAEQNAIGAHDLLGQIVRAFHVQPQIVLPLAGMGEGRLDAVQVTVDMEMAEKVWTHLQVRPRPWIVLDIGPIQILRTEAPGAAPPIVHPGGIRFAQVDVVTPPAIARLSPAAVAPGGRVRIDAVYSGAPARVTVGDVRIVPPDLSTPEPAGPVLFTLPNGVTPSAYDVSLTTATSAPSQPQTLVVQSPTLTSLDAPAVLRHSRASNLVLSGHALGAGNVTLTFWPEAGISNPGDVVTVAATAAGNSLTASAAALAGLRNTVYRISLQYAAHAFTPYVLLEIVA